MLTHCNANAKIPNFRPSIAACAKCHLGWLPALPPPPFPLPQYGDTASSVHIIGRYVIVIILPGIWGKYA